MYRISITYENIPGAPFNWDYYMNNHLPLAVGTSMRHSGLNFCDADRPLNNDSPHTCVCMVHFDSEQSMDNFCNFFVTEHPESKKIGMDEINYTTIPPEMVTATCSVEAFAREASAVSHRLKLFFRLPEAQDARAEVPETILNNLLASNEATAAGLLSTELDRCRSGLVSGSVPDYWFIWALNFSSRENAEEFAEKLGQAENHEVLEKISGVKPGMMLSEIMPFDLALTEPYRLAGEA